MSNLFRFFCCISSEADVLLCKILVVSLTIDFLRLRDQIFRVLLEHFISEVVHKWQQDQMF